jgi:transcription antitermination factor NusA-like protein
METNLPICAICAKTGVLCSACEEKLKSGKISELDVELSKRMQTPGKEDIGFDRAIDTKNFVIILAKKDNVGKIIGKSGDNIKQLSKDLGKQVRVISTGNLQEMIHDFVSPAHVIGVNRVYKPDGSTVQRVKINKNDKKKLRMDVEEVENLIASVSDSNVEISFE